MSLNSIQEVNCPQCGNTQNFVRWDSVNVTLDPDLKEKVLNRDIMTFECEKCDQKTVFIYQFLYHDMDKKILIHLVPEDEYNDVKFDSLKLDYPDFFVDQYRLRIVNSLDELIEKILIFEEDFDDKVMEIFKAYILTHEITDKSEGEVAKIFYSCCVPMKNNEMAIIINIIKNGTQTQNTYPLDVYVNMEKEFSPKLIDSEGKTDKWLRVDLNYSISAMNTLVKN